MLIPAMDSVESKRVGVVKGTSFDLATIMHDMSTPERNHGKYFRVARPIAIRSAKPVSLENIYSTAEEHEFVNFSQEFWVECDKTYRAVHPEYSLEKTEEFDFNKCVSNSSSAGEFEAYILTNIHHNLSSERASNEVWNSILQNARWNKVDDSETGDTDIFGDKDQSSFTESDFSTQLYLPQMNRVDRWGLYSYTMDSTELEIGSLWYRFESGNSITELPLISYSDNRVTMFSSDPDFGGMKDNHISKQLGNALEHREVTDELSPSECQLMSKIKEIDTLGELTTTILDSASDSSPVLPDKVAENI